ncbi:dihydroorotase [Clostridium sp. YIM B02551]|uniref:dihydroorotase n=1 Tax=Clostridium sp. YIM B02551 TaxID=2910679 RepID=UPI001EEC58E7|nr:dihydroorotase [Clostridium sp. YIM B02551]
MDLLIKAVRIVDESHDFVGDLYIENGLIKEIGTSIDKNVQEINGEGLTLMPSFIDTHVHFREPGFTYKEDIETGSRAALKGGFTFVNLMANTNPICSSKEVLDYVYKRNEEVGLIDLHQCLSITKDFDGKSITHLNNFQGNLVVKAISDDGKGVMDSKVMLDAMGIAKNNNWVVISHAENHEFSNIDMRLAENLMTLRDVELAKYSKAKLHMAHISTKEAMKCVIDGKKEGANVTAEVTPHHIALNKDISNYRVNPPIREEEDRKYLIKAIKDGYVDVIGTDHAPHGKEDKENGAPGMVGLETAFSICYTTLVKDNEISLKTLSKLMSANPGELLGINKGRISPGYDGDLVLVDLNSKNKINSNNFASKSNNTPFDGLEYFGEVVMTIKAGKIAYRK